MRHLPILLLLGLVFATSSTRAENCTLPKLEDVPQSHPECLFFSGTAAFRDKKYERAFEAWSTLVGKDKISIQHEYLRTDAMNNLGYLHYTGLGTTPTVQRAIELWLTAFGRGHEEAAYHLCHVFAEPKEPEYSSELGRGYCLEALRRYRALKDTEGENEKVVEYIQAYLAALPTQ